MMIPIDKMSTTDKVIESIRSYIQEPGRNPGEKLPTENELGKQLGVGRSSIREALRVLQTMGYVTIVHGKGAFIKACQPSSEEAERWFEGNIFALRDIYMVREALEPLIAREAARHITEEALAELRQIVDQTAHAAALPPERLGTADSFCARGARFCGTAEPSSRRVRPEWGAAARPALRPPPEACPAPGPDPPKRCRARPRSGMRPERQPGRRPEPDCAESVLRET